MTTFLLAAGMLLTGSTNTLSKKIQFQTHQPGQCAVDESFNKPWFQTGIMFLGEALCIAFYFIQRWLWPAKKVVGLAEVPQPPRPKTWRMALLFLLLAVCDLAGTTLAGIGLLYTPASVYQMLRGSVICFTGLWSVLFLKRHLEPFRWAGISIVVCGLILVGLSGLLGTETKTEVMLFILGCCLIVLAQMANSTQFVIEEKNMKALNLSPLLVVGCEGCWGFLLTVSVALPIVTAIPGTDCGSYENEIDSLIQLTKSAFLDSMVGTYWLSIAFYNGLSLTMAKLLTSVHRTLIDACRTLFVWCFQLLLFYTTAGKFGEQWQAYSWIQVIGFVLLMTGTLTYNHVLDWMKVARVVVVLVPIPSLQRLVRVASVAADVGEKAALLGKAAADAGVAPAVLVTPSGDLGEKDKKMGM